jgi:hypothetical protein
MNKNKKNGSYSCREATQWSLGRVCEPSDKLFIAIFMGLKAIPRLCKGELVTAEHQN